jgi:hypothetical protein
MTAAAKPPPSPAAATDTLGSLRMVTAAVVDEVQRRLELGTVQEHLVREVLKSSYLNTLSSAVACSDAGSPVVAWTRPRSQVTRTV